MFILGVFLGFFLDFQPEMFLRDIHFKKLFILFLINASINCRYKFF